MTSARTTASTPAFYAFVSPRRVAGALLRLLHPGTPKRPATKSKATPQKKPAKRLPPTNDTPQFHPLKVADSQLRLIARSVTEDSRIRKVKEPWTVDWIRRIPPDGVLFDVGATIGIFTHPRRRNRAERAKLRVSGY
jgi:hypothetical protein